MKTKTKLNGLKYYYELLKLQSFLRNLDKNFKYQLESFSFNPENQILEFSGWAFTKEDGKPVDILLTPEQGKVLEFSRKSVEEVVNKYGIDPDEKIGFKLKVELPDEYSNSKNFDFAIRNKTTEQVIPVSVSLKGKKQLTLDQSAKYYSALLREYGFSVALKQAVDQGLEAWSPYKVWLNKVNKYNKENIIEDIQKFYHNPKISLVMVVDNNNQELLIETLESIKDQLYENWELIIFDNASTSRNIKKILSNFASKDARVTVKRAENKVSKSLALNNALNLASGDYIGFLEEDVLEPVTLYKYVKAINADPKLDFIYTDYDFVEDDLNDPVPVLHSNFNPRLILGTNYLSNSFIISSELLDEIGALRSKYEGSHIYDLVLRALEKSRKNEHISNVLYHNKALRSLKPKENKDKEIISSKNLIEDHLKQKNIKANFKINEDNGVLEIIREDIPEVSIILVNDGSPESEKTLEELNNNTDYPNFTIIAVNFNETTNLPNTKFYWNNAPLTRNELINYAARKGTGEYLVFVEPSIYPVNKNWLKALIDETALDKSVIIGPTIEEIQTIKSDANPYLKMIPINYQGISSKAFLINKGLWEEIGGFDPKYNEFLRDHDLILKAKKVGYNSILTPRSVMSNLKKPKENYSIPEQFGRFYEEYSSEDMTDPYFPNGFQDLNSPIIVN